MPSTDSINVLAELERIGVAYDWAGDEEIKCACPFHDDTSPSCSVNVEKRLFKCQVPNCGSQGDIISLLARYLKTSRAVVIADLSKRYVFDTAKIIDPQTVERYHQAIWQAKPLLKQLHARGVTDALIRKYRLGESDGRVTIPITNEGGLYVNIRKYLPGAPGAQKMRNSKGHGKPRLYPIEQLKYDEVVICGGEMKAIVAAEQLNRSGIGAVCVTAGEGKWDNSITSYFQGKKVWVCMDIDDAGQSAAEIVLARLYRVARWQGNVVLPLDKDKYPKGDVNDYVAKEKGRLKKLLDVEEWKPRVAGNVFDNETRDVDLVQAINAEETGKRLRMKAVVTAMDTAPYVIPQKVTVVCDKSQPECVSCPAFPHEDMTHELHPESPAVLDMIAAHKNVQRDAIAHGLGIPGSCKVVSFVPLTYFNAEDVRVSPQLEITSRAADRVMQPAICIGRGIELNESYELTGRMYPHPKTQQSTLLISEYKPTQDALSTYKPVDLDRLSIFQPDNWSISGLEGLLDGLYTDLEANITRIYQRRDLHLIVDLAYHSPLFLTFDGRTVKGWLEALVLGDSAQGKSETTINLMKHYGLGEKVECKNATVAGLLGGLQMMGNRWFVTWGVIPTHDKRLVVLEELKGTSTEVIGKLTDMRSSGIAEIPKIEKRRTHARTRLIALSNPRSNRPLSAYNFGIEAIKELIGGLEDIRRFDVCLLVGANEIDADKINQLQRKRPDVEHKYTSDLCRSLILWAWTRTPEQITFDRDASELTLDEATILSKQFSDVIPIVDSGSARYKIARLAAALACRTFSTDDMQTIRVRTCHVKYVVDMLKRVYSSSTFGYADFTEAVNMTEALVDPEGIKKQINDTPFPADLVKHILHTSRIELSDIQDWCAWDRSEAQILLSYFVRKHALQRDGRCYRKTPPFIRLLKSMIEGKQIVARPDFIEEEF